MWDEERALDVEAEERAAAEANLRQSVSEVMDAYQGLLCREAIMRVASSEARAWAERDFNREEASNADQTG